MEVQLKLQESTSDNSWGHHESGTGLVRGEEGGRIGLHLADTGVYKNRSEFIENSSYFPPSWW